MMKNDVRYAELYIKFISHTQTVKDIYEQVRPTLAFPKGAPLKLFLELT
jgi:hypothetical protein